MEIKINQFQIPCMKRIRVWKKGEEEIAENVISLSAYCIFMTLDTMEIAVADMIKELRANKELCNFRGYVKELNAVEAELKQQKIRTLGAQGNYRQRMKIINAEIHEYMTETLRNIRISVWNWGLKYGGHNPRVLSAITTAQAVTYWAMCNVKFRYDEMMEHENYGKDLTRIKPAFPTRLNEKMVDLVDRCASMVGDPEEGNVSINDCQELLTGLKVLNNTISDMDLLELHSAFAIEEEIGPERMKAEHLAKYYLLHPSEDPEVIAAKKAKEEQEAKEAEERRKAFEEMEEEKRKEKEREEAGAEAWAEELEAARGWRVSKKCNHKKNRGNR